MWIDLFNILIKLCTIGTCRPPGKHYFRGFHLHWSFVDQLQADRTLTGHDICLSLCSRDQKHPLELNSHMGHIFPHPLLGQLSSIHQLTDPLWHYDTGQNICVPILPSEIRMKRIWWKPQENPWKIFVSHLAWFSSLFQHQQPHSATNMAYRWRRGLQSKYKVCSEQTKLDITNGFCGTIKAGWHKDFLQ